MSIIKNQSGTLFISDIIRIMIIMSLILSFIYLPRPFIRYIQLNHICETIVEHIEVNGQINSNTHSLVNDLLSCYQIDPQIYVNDTELSSINEHRIQLQDTFVINVVDSIEIIIYKPSFYNNVSITLPINKKIMGASHVYWKNTP